MRNDKCHAMIWLEYVEVKVHWEELGVGGNIIWELMVL